MEHHHPAPPPPGITTRHRPSHHRSAIFHPPPIPSLFSSRRGFVQEGELSSLEEGAEGGGNGVTHDLRQALGPGWRGQGGAPGGMAGLRVPLRRGSRNCSVHGWRREV
jgi:hypothetical protein